MERSKLLSCKKSCVRPATVADLASIADIENREIAENWAHFGTESVSLDETQRAFDAAKHRYLWLVAEVESKVVGFARAGPWKTRGGYRWTCEIGVYVSPEFHGQGVGKALYAELFPALEQAGLKSIIAGIALPNPASVRLHEAFGMKHIGTFPECGFKFDRWIDVGYWVKRI